MQLRREADARARALFSELFQCDAADFSGISQAGLAKCDDSCGYDLGYEVIAIEQAKRLQEILKSKIQNFDLVRFEIAIPQKSIDRHPVHLNTGATSRGRF